MMSEELRTRVESSDGEGETQSFGRFQVLFWILLALHLAVVLLGPRVPAQDFPVHLASSAALSGLLFGNGSEIAAHYYEINPTVSPTWGAHLLLVLLLQVFSPAWVQKIVLGLYVLALPLAARGLLASAARSTTWRALVFSPLLLNFPFHTGLFSFCFSLPALLWLLALWLRPREPDSGVGWVLGAGAVATLLAIAHPVTWVVGALALSCLLLHETLSARVGWSVVRRRVIQLVATLAPGALLIGAFSAGQTQGPLERWPWSVMWRSIATLNSLVSFDRREVFLTTLWGSILVAASVWVWIRRRRRDDGNRFDGLLWAAAAVLVLYFVSPDSAAGGSLITPRLDLCFWLVLTSWLVVQTWARPARLVLVTGAAGISMALLMLHAASYLRIQSAFQEVWAVAPYLEPQSTLLPLVFTARGLDAEGEPLSIKVRPFISAGSALAGERGLVDLNNYQAITGYFPIVFRPEVDPAGRLWRRTEAGLQLDIAGYQRETEGTVDYVLLWGYRPGKSLFGRDVSRMPRDLIELYEPVYASDEGRLLLFARRDLPHVESTH